jgi:hypothetical protein
MFSAFSPLNGGQLDPAMLVKQPMMFSNHGDLNYTRLPNHQAIHPYPYGIGYVQGLLPLFDQAEFHAMQGREPFGPYMGPDKTLPNFNVVFPNIMGGLSKTTG